MRRLLLVLLFSGVASADQVYTCFAASGTNGSGTCGVIATGGYTVATVSIAAASGSPDGTVTIYVDGKSVYTYATPTTLKVIRGPVAGKLAVGLSGNTTGTVDVTVRLK